VPSGLQWLFTKFWDGQAKNNKAIAEMSQKKIGEIEHAFILKAVSRKVEQLVNAIDRSDNAREVQLYNNELKVCLRLLAEWDNEYKRLYKIPETHDQRIRAEKAQKIIREASGPVADWVHERAHSLDIKSNETIGSVYKDINEGTGKLDEIVISRIYDDETKR